MILTIEDYNRIGRQLMTTYLNYFDARMMAQARGVEPHRSNTVRKEWERHLAGCAAIGAVLDVTPYRIRILVDTAAIAAETVAKHQERRRDWIETAHIELAKLLEQVTGDES